jgi:SAM-dependent methyltransferase
MTNNLPEDADIHSASDEYAARFGGSAGRWFLSVQAKAIQSLLGGPSLTSESVLDVGGGHAQVAPVFRALGYSVTILASHPDGLTQARRVPHDPKLVLATGNLIALPFEDKKFDLVSSFRLLPHCNAWPTLIQELCRVARTRVLVDYPVDQGFNRLSFLFGAKKKFEGNTRPYLSFRNEELMEHFDRAGFRCVGFKRQFFFPMVLHRFIKWGALSEIFEALPRVLGATKVIGSPVVALFERYKE